MVETTGNASIEIAASTEHVWGVLTDLSRISELSPECYKAEWKDGSTGPEVGAKFHGYNEAGGNKWDVGCEVVAAEPGREWAFKIPSDVGDTVWRYTIEASDGGCTVTESFDAPLLATEHFLKIKRHQLLVDNIATTLSNLKEVAEA